jgi:NAD(P)-dependent dehydrogenase (short-subunit alcohol dehydrogenase family)
VGVMGDLDGLGYRDTTAVVVGCSTGIGEATARILGDLGARVHAVSRNEPKVPFEAFYPTDITDFDNIAATADALGKIGPIDHVLTCSGVPFTRPPSEVLQVNYIGLRHLVESIVPAVADGGNIAVSGSNTAYGWEAQLQQVLELVKIDDPHEAIAWCEEHADLVSEGFSSYVMSKHALIIWVTYAAAALGERGIRLNCVCPGLTETPMVEEIVDRAGTRDLVDSYPNPLFGRITTAEEAAWPLVLLNSRRNAVVTGAVLFADQGSASGLAAGSVTFL